MLVVSESVAIFSALKPITRELISPVMDMETLKVTIAVIAAPMASLYFHTKEMMFFRAVAPSLMIFPASLAIFFSSPLLAISFISSSSSSATSTSPSSAGVISEAAKFLICVPFAFSRSILSLKAFKPFKVV